MFEAQCGELSKVAYDLSRTNLPLSASDSKRRYSSPSHGTDLELDETTGNRYNLLLDPNGLHISSTNGSFYVYLSNRYTAQNVMLDVNGSSVPGTHFESNDEYFDYRVMSKTSPWPLTLPAKQDLSDRLFNRNGTMSGNFCKRDLQWPIGIDDRVWDSHFIWHPTNHPVDGSISHHHGELTSIAYEDAANTLGGIQQDLNEDDIDNGSFVLSSISHTCDAELFASNNATQTSVCMLFCHSAVADEDMAQRYVEIALRQLGRDLPLLAEYFFTSHSSRRERSYHSAA